MCKNRIIAYLSVAVIVGLVILWLKDPFAYKSPFKYWIINPENFGQCIQATGVTDLTRVHILDPAISGNECSFRWKQFTGPQTELH